MEELVVINNSYLADQIMFYLDKSNNEFYLSELANVTELVINFDDIDESIFAVLEELILLPNLKNLTIRHAFIYNDNFNIFLSLNIKEIVFDNCEFENALLLATLKVNCLSLVNIQINNYNFISALNNLESLTIINGNVSLDRVNNLVKLKYLNISFSSVDGNNIILDNLRELHIENTNIDNLEFIRNIKSLRVLSVDNKQYQKNKKLLDELNYLDLEVIDNIGGNNHE